MKLGFLRKNAKPPEDESLPIPRITVFGGRQYIDVKTEIFRFKVLNVRAIYAILKTGKVIFNRKENKMKAVIYARYSSDNQREESIEGQLRECMAFAERKGYTVIKSYADRAISGKRADNRPEFQRMIADSAKGEFDVVIVWKIDRFSRDKYDSVIYKSKLNKNGVSVISATEPIDDSPEGKLMESIFEGFSEYYVKDLELKQAEE